MNEENARRLAARQERDRLKITVAEVESYRELHYPGSRAKRDGAADRHVAALSHEGFHRWFGTVCDETCPHAKHALPVARVRRPWWRRWFR